MRRVYSRYSLPELTGHVVASLERRRAAFSEWNAQTEAALTADARATLTQAHAGFVELADDEGHWQRVEHTLLTVALPRYFQLAKTQFALEQAGYGAWRRGDAISRAAYAGLGLLLAAIVWRTAIPDWLEPLPLALFLGGPLLPDAQAWWAKRQYAKALAKLVDDMAQEEADSRQYQPLGLASGVGPVAPVSTEQQQAAADSVKNESR